MKISPALLGGLAFVAHAVTASATNYNGNTGAGFNGSVGYGILSITSNAAAGTVTFTESPSASGTQYTAGGNFSGNNLVLYIDTVTGGLADTSSLTDTSDGGREAISGYNSGNNTRALATFASGFAADYAISFDDSGNSDLFSLASGTITYLSQGSTTTPYTITVTAANLGLPTLTSTTTFKFVGTLISQTAYRSSEAIGSATTGGTALQSASNPGASTAITYTNFNTFAVPEPGSVAVLGLGGLLLTGLTMRRLRSQV